VIFWAQIPTSIQLIPNNWTWNKPSSIDSIVSYSITDHIIPPQYAIVEVLGDRQVGSGNFEAYNLSFKYKWLTATNWKLTSYCPIVEKSSPVNKFAELLYELITPIQAGPAVFLPNPPPMWYPNDSPQTLDDSLDTQVSMRVNGIVQGYGISSYNHTLIITYIFDDILYQWKVDSHAGA
tara:strand:+ start:5372 stop:5908 length:537 start_codon:yes stop_codon:yes gene_type:complete